jgi:hypothetical protein
MFLIVALLSACGDDVSQGVKLDEENSQFCDFAVDNERVYIHM